MRLFDFSARRRAFLAEHLRLEDGEGALVLHRDTALTRHARALEGALLAGAGGLAVLVLAMWALPGAVWATPALSVKAVLSIGLLWGALLMFQSGRQGLCVQTRIDHRAGTLQIAQSTFAGRAQVVGQVPIALVDSFYIVRVRSQGAPSHFYARVSDGGDAIYLGSDSEAALERLHARLSGTSSVGQDAVMRPLVGRAKLRHNEIFAA